MKKSKKLAVVVSSFSGMLKEEADNLEGIYLLPLQIFIDSQDWLEGFYSDEEKYEIVEKFKKCQDFKTSLTPIGWIENQMEELSKKYDDVIYLPINSSLSSTYNTVVNTANKYKNVHVVDNWLNGHVYVDVAVEIKKRYEKNNQSIEDIISFLNWFNERTIGYIIPFELKTFIKSGRLKGLKKAIMGSLKLSAIIQVSKTVDNIGIARTKKNAVSKVIQKLDEFISKKWRMHPNDFIFSTINTYEKDITNLFESEVKSFFKRTVDSSREASIVTMLHTGWAAGYVGVSPKLNIIDFSLKKSKKIA